MIYLFVCLWPNITKICLAFLLALLYPLNYAEGYEEIEDRLRILVDVRDVAEALILVYERPEAEGRYICYAYTAPQSDLVEILRKNYPNLNYPKR